MKCLYPYTTSEGFEVGCGRCRWCRVHRTHEWAIRLVHELAAWPAGQALFLTMTYDDEHLPVVYDPTTESVRATLVKTDLQKYFKRVRKTIHPNKIRYYACGEYGPETQRPHYHAIIYGISPEKHKELWLDWRKCLLDRFTVDYVTYNNCAYVAGYIQKKLGGDMALKAYGMTEHPFQLQSRGLGLEHARNECENITEDLAIRIGGRYNGIPRYYQKKLEIPADSLREKAKKRTREINAYLAKQFPTITERRQAQIDSAKLQDEKLRWKQEAYKRDGL